jgi:hypothetical protein
MMAPVDADAVPMPHRGAAMRDHRSPSSTATVWAMSWPRRPARLLVAGASCLVVVAAVAFAIAWRDPAARGSTPTVATTAAPATAAATSTSASPTTIGGGTTSSALAATTTTHPPGFIDAAEARDSAQSLVSAYIESQFGATVTDAACSLPPTGAVGDHFVCYALRPGDLVIALRATIGDDQLITLALITDEGAPTTTTTAAPTTTAA